VRALFNVDQGQVVQVLLAETNTVVGNANDLVLASANGTKSVRLTVVVTDVDGVSVSSPKAAEHVQQQQQQQQPQEIELTTFTTKSPPAIDDDEEEQEVQEGEPSNAALPAYTEFVPEVEVEASTYSPPAQGRTYTKTTF